MQIRHEICATGAGAFFEVGSGCACAPFHAFWSRGEGLPLLSHGECTSVRSTYVVLSCFRLSADPSKRSAFFDPSTIACVLGLTLDEREHRRRGVLPGAQRKMNFLRTDGW